jgi:glycerol kinase
MDDTTKVQLLALTAAAGASLASLWLHSGAAKSAASPLPPQSSSSSSAASSSKNKLAGGAQVYPPFVGALDQGTSSTRFIVFDSRTNIVVSHQMELPPLYPRPGFVIALAPIK